MQLLRPSSSVCYKLKLPQVDTITSNTLISDVDKRLLTLDYRTGAAIQLFKSNIFVHGGIIIPLNLSDITTKSIQEELMLYFAKQVNSSSSSSSSSSNTDSFHYPFNDPSSAIINFNTLSDWISPNIFTLDLITRKWSYLETFVPEHSNVLKRLFHSIVLHDNKLYLFGGLIVSPTNGYGLIASNELWELDLHTRYWKLHEINPDLTRRYNHSMMVHVDSTGTPRLIVVGGKDNLDHDVLLVDIFNIRTGVWESLDLNKSGTPGIITNVHGVPNAINKSNNVPVLIDNDIIRTNFTSNGAAGLDKSNTGTTLSDHKIVSDVPIIVYYNTSHHDGNICTSGNNTNCDQIPNDKEIPSPIVALSLLPNSQGLRMNSFQDKETLKIPLNLQNLSIASYKRGLVLTGFYPTTNRSDFHCYIYDLSCAFWTKVAIDCPDSDINHHRFNELFVWKSHHRAVVLGTENDDHYGPTVQRFDYLLSFRLAMMNVLKEVPRYILDYDKGEMVPLIPDLDQKKSPLQKRNLSSLSTNTNNHISQFENYIKYVTTPLEIESTSSVFPPYALVLGKDSMEVFGQSISDFELISSSGDSVSVPIYLLRERWGRYFDMLLANAYSYARRNQNSRNTIPQQNMTNNLNIAKDKSHMSFNANTGRNGSLSSQISDEQLSPSSSVPDILSPKYLNANKNRANMFNRTSFTKSNNKTEIPVFRVPFQDSNSIDNNANGKETKSLKKPSTFNVAHSSKPHQRRSSSVLGSMAYLRITKDNEPERRASHPVCLDTSMTNNPIDKINISSTIYRSRRSSSLRNFPNPQNSRRPSIMSQHPSRRASILSLVSSSSDRRGVNVNSLSSRNNSMCNSSSESSYSPVLYELVNASIPPASVPPTMSLPPTPVGSVSGVSSFQLQKSNTNNASHTLNSLDNSTSTNSRQNSLEFNNSPRHVSISSKRSSYESRFQSSKSTKSSSFSELTTGHSIIEESMYPPQGLSTSPNAVLSSSPSSSFASSSFSAVTSPHDSASLSGSSLSLNNEEFASHPPLSDQVDLDPLLIPRSLYMPWPTKTVKAFTEFFYTGKVNGKWNLAPTVLDLFIMSYLYEVPLLYDMITEVLYMLIGKKEETLKLTAKNMISGYVDMIGKFHNGDTEVIESSLAENGNYQDLLQLKESLDNINNGFLDRHILEKYILNKGDSRKFSGVDSEISEYSNIYQSDILSMGKRRRKTDSGDNTDKDISNVDVLYSGGPRDSQDSLGSLLYLRHKSIINPRRKQSSLSKELNFDIWNGGDDGDVNIANKQEGYLIDHREGLNDLTQKLKDFKIRGKSISKGRNLNEKIHRPSFSSPCSSSSSSGDSSNEGEETYSIGSISSRKIRRELRLEEELDESIDPLLKLGNNISSPTFGTNNNLLKNHKLNQRNILGNREGSFTSTPSPSRLNSFVGSIQSGPKGRNSKIGAFDIEEDNIDGFQDVTLESLVSTSEKSIIKIVDYIIKLIYRTSVMVNDARLMLRCMDCIEFSNILKRIKVNMIKDYNKLNQVKKSTSIKTSSLSPVVPSSPDRHYSTPKRIERQYSKHMLNIEESPATLSQKVTSQSPVLEENSIKKDTKNTTTINTTITTNNNNNDNNTKDLSEDKRETSMPLSTMSLASSLTFPFFGKKRS